MGPAETLAFTGFFDTRTLDKTMKDRKHLVSAEVKKLMDATKGSRNATRDSY